MYQLIAVTRNDICRSGRESISLWIAIIYYTSVYLYLYIFSAIIASIVFGSYLYICINWLNLHYDEAFSSLQIADYKAFTRFHIKHNGDLEVFTLAVDKVRNQTWFICNSRIVQLLKMQCRIFLINFSVFCSSFPLTPFLSPQPKKKKKKET